MNEDLGEELVSEDLSDEVETLMSDEEFQDRNTA